jgi:nitrite reductase (NAD(P)H)
MALSQNGITNVAVKYGDTQLAVYHVSKRGFYATQQMWAKPSFPCILRANIS